MSSAVPSVPWHEFARDPRTPQARPLRASHRDRAVVQDVLTEAYADGRLTRDELDERVAAAEQATTLGELTALLADLAPTEPTSRDEVVLRDPDALHAQAPARFRSQRREALIGFLVPTVVCWAIWVATSVGVGQRYFPWPVFVTLVTGRNAARYLFGQEGIVAQQRRSLERRLEKRLRRERALEAGGAEAAALTADDGDDPVEPDRHPPHRHDHRRR